ncbi:MAG: hemolysin III family protein [Elusimicrobiota bacterium]
MTLYPFLGLHDPFSSLSHLTAAVAVLTASYFLYKKGRGDTARSTSLFVFSASLLFLFTMSGIYHGLAPGPWRALFRRLDYAAIWIVIAGSATPVHTLLLRGHWRWSMTALFWGCAITCLVLLEVYFTRLPYWAIVSAYIGLGSLGLISFSHITTLYGWKEATLLMLGGIAYSTGAVIDFIDRPVIIPGVVGPHELFHLLVMAGAFLHWLFIYNWADGQETTVNAAWQGPPAPAAAFDANPPEA